ncbi:AraC family transcriptional regulator [Coraliomargarita algicola]|uniref:AraC family transcriptional regulator n=1 Tax=Coraliomargarita algicola TaxID=3092156 RepID=A0ABZ0RP11_9BACT|nr:AraC family transcriptional regulator [Coraliomargarita sp. J2-16]WPJ94684.1 AraC family transcriptional regulator [Coraliomargarita sp. J2-16]
MQIDTNTRVLSAGEVLYLAPHQRHAVCGFEPDFCGVYTLALFDADVVGASLRPDLESVARFIDLCEFLLGERTEAIKALRLGEWLLSVREPVRPTLTDLPAATAPDMVQRVKTLLDAALGERVPFDEIARRCGCSKEHCNRQFKAQYGVTIQTYQLNRKAERARDLLATDRPLSDIALEAGFYDQSHLSRVFKSIFQLTPEAYRRQQSACDQSHTR